MSNEKRIQIPNRPYVATPSAAQVSPLNQLAQDSPLNQQVGGSHYKDMKIQPIEFISANGLGFMEGNIVKYVSRHKTKNGAEDVKKIIHYAKLILSLEYGYTPEQLREL